MVTVKTKSESKLIKEIAKKMGYASFSLSEAQKRMIARLKMSQLSDGQTQVKTLSIDEIQNEVDSVRAQRYAAKKGNKGSNIH